MTLRFYDTASAEVRNFVPIVDGKGGARRQRQTRQSDRSRAQSLKMRWAVMEHVTIRRATI